MDTLAYSRYPRRAQAHLLHSFGHALVYLGAGKPKLDSSICIRCKEEKGVLVIRHASYCK